MGRDPLTRGRTDARSGHATREARTLADGERFVTRLHEEHAAALFAYALARCGDRLAAEEVVQEVLVAAWRNADRYDAARGSERQWLFGIARNAVVDRHRRERRALRLVARPTDEALADDDLERVVEVSHVADALGRLSVEHREVIVEAYYDGRSTREIATRRGIPAGTVKSRLFYGLRALRIALEEGEILR